MGFLGSLFGSDQADAAKKAAKIQSKTADKNRALATQFTTQSLGDLDSALAAALGEMNTGQQAATGALEQYLTPYADQGQNALQTLMGALGLGGEEARANALSAFQTGPGYGFAMDEGVNALDRSAAAKGGLYSGAQGKALTRFGQGLANQEYGNWLSRIGGLADTGYSAATNLAQGKGDILSNFASGRADAMLGTARDKATVRSDGLGSINTASTESGQARAGGVLGAAQARAAGAGNILNLIGAGTKLLTGGVF